MREVRELEERGAALVRRPAQEYADALLPACNDPAGNQVQFCEAAFRQAPQQDQMRVLSEHTAVRCGLPKQLL